MRLSTSILPVDEVDIDLLEIAANYDDLAKRIRKEADAMHVGTVYGEQIVKERHAKADKLQADAEGFRKMADKS